jgi:hypothetical protein
MRMAGAFAHAAGFASNDKMIVSRRKGRIRITERTHTDAIDRMGLEHRHTGAPDVQTSAQRSVEGLIGALGNLQRALHAQLETVRGFPRHTTGNRQ